MALVQLIRHIGKLIQAIDKTTPLSVQHSFYIAKARSSHLDMRKLHSNNN
jgi:hypothetical protein